MLIGTLLNSALLCSVYHTYTTSVPLARYARLFTVLLRVRVGHPLIRYSLARLSECNCVLCLT